MSEIIFNPRYKSIDKIGFGSFGEIYKVYDLVEKKIRAVKIEKNDKMGAKGMLLKEAQIMKQMKDCHHFPKLIEEMSNDEMSFIIMSFLGENLETLKKKYNKISNYSSLLIGSQMVEALQLMHEKGFLHRDIKPENFVIGTEGNHHNIYVIDFGLSKKYIDLNNKHIPEDNNKGLVGTARYTSINSHKGKEQSRRDDLEALGYVLIYLAKGELPWQNITLERREEKFEQIKLLKMETSILDLCKGLPNSFKIYMEHVKSLSFDQEPQYKYLIQQFLKDAKEIYKQQNMSNLDHYCLDWCEENCSIKKQLQDQIQRQQQQKSNNNNKANCSQKNITDIGNNGKKKEAQFTETAQFYEDTVERPQNLPGFEIPFFRTEKSISISKHIYGNFPHFSSQDGINFSSKNKKQNNSNQRKQTLFLQLQLNDFKNDQDIDHSQNSSQYNNFSNEYTPQQDEKVRAQQVVPSQKHRFSMTDHQIYKKSLTKEKSEIDYYQYKSLQNIDEV